VAIHILAGESRPQLNLGVSGILSTPVSLADVSLGACAVPVPTPLITRSPDRLSGAAVFAGTRVPVQTLIEYLEGGDPLDAFLADFPSVTREHAVAVLELAREALDAQASAA